jgi:two-component system chemotaxis sensor kinase CheA
VRVRTELLDQMLDGAGELLLATARVREVGKSVPQSSRGPLDEEVDRLHTLVKDLHAKVMKARMTPIAMMTDRLPRAARDIARKRDRDVELTITGDETELDRAIVDELNDPLLHLLRNAIDHGIENPVDRERVGKAPRGRVQVNVRRDRDRVVLEVEDDGKGMDVEKLKASAVSRGMLTPDAAAQLPLREALMLACLPGVSTATDITDISGRGVGMDAVKRAIESVGGSLEIESQLGKGTRFRLLLPLTVAVVQLLLVQVGEETFGVPVAKVTGVIEFPEEQLARTQESPLLPFGSALVPVYSLADLLTVPHGTLANGARPFVVVEAESGKVALGVDRLQGQEEVVLKALSRPLDLVPGLAGVTILGNGRPIFILDVPRLLS